MNIHSCSWDNHGTRERWSVPDLWRAAEGMQVLTLSVRGFEEARDVEEWLRNPTKHPDDMARILRADLSYPILLHPSWWVMDGYHRIGRSLLEGRDLIQAIRFLPENLPAPDFGVRCQDTASSPSRTA